MKQQPLISIVDDDEGIRSSLDGLMRSLGYRVAVFESAERFLESELARDSKCVVSDIQMPGGMSGLELLSKVRGSDSIVPVILISAFTTAEAREEADRAGAYCTLRKPFDGDDLARCVDRALSSQA
ncbi:Response regulator receiver domain-containing protein [Sphingomonas sp. NFR04]|uniref:response regulator transcription factor n=1 Tax=Sphingomonas sp. NFR04 TaxID=1566283 RepID=UPI0008EC6CA3|nr:response regulator [Sphingomonas sp. NFR04]SFK60397.1 Response regulator receiver domain-containing protein [Sphingomonas sp. NFR04]